MTGRADPGGRPDGDTPPGVPRWVIVSLLVGAAVLLLLVAAMLITGGQHGPGRHTGGPQSPDGAGQSAAHGVALTHQDRSGRSGG